MSFEFNQLIHADVIEGLKKIPDRSVTLIVTSPPYNVAAKEWSYGTANDDQPYVAYIKWLGDVFRECYRVLRTGGRICINIDAMFNRQDDKDREYIRDIRTDLANELKPMGFLFYGEHVWYKSNKDPISETGEISNAGQFNGKKTAWGSYMSCSTPAVRRNHEYILVYSKEQFKLEPAEDSGEPDITDVEFQTYIASLWPMLAETRNLGDHPVPFPEELPYRCIKLYSYVNDVVLDPFNGTGTTTVVAHGQGRRYIGIDMDKGYIDYAEDRLAVVPAYEPPNRFVFKSKKKKVRHEIDQVFEEEGVS